MSSRSMRGAATITSPARHVGHAQHAFEHEARFGRDELAVFGVGQGVDQFGPRIGAGRDELDQALEQAALVACVTQVPRRLGV